MIAGQVVRTELGEERVIDLHDNVSDNKENSSLPAYLSDEDSPVKVGQLCEAMNVSKCGCVGSFS